MRECLIGVNGLQTRVEVSRKASFMLPLASDIGVASVFEVLRRWCKGSLRQTSGRRRVHPLSKLLFKRRVVSHARALPSGCRQYVREAALLKGIRVHLACSAGRQAGRGECLGTVSSVVGVIVIRSETFHSQIG